MAKTVGGANGESEFQARLDELADKANEGILSPQESRAYDKDIEYMDFIALMRLKARSRVSASPQISM